MDQRSCGQDAENVRSLLGDGTHERRNGTGDPHAPETHSSGTRRNHTEPVSIRPPSTVPQPIILPRRVPALDWPATLYDDTQRDLDAADDTGGAMLRIVRQAGLADAHDQRVIRLTLGHRSDWRL